MSRKRYPYGFRISTFRLESANHSSGTSGPMQDPMIDLDTTSAKTLMVRALHRLAEQGTTSGQGKQHTITEVHDASAEGFVLVKVSGGRAGSRFNIHDEGGALRGQVRESDALVWPGRVLIVFAHDDARRGFLVHETYSGRTHMEDTRGRLYAHMVKQERVFLHLEHDVADNVVWDHVLKDGTAELSEVEFRSKAPDGVVLGDGEKPTGVVVKYSLDNTPARSFLGKGARTQVSDLINSVGVVPYADDFAEGEAVAEIMTEHGPRRLQIGRKPYPFTRVIESPSQVDDVEFLHEVSPDLVDLASRIGMAIPSPFLPGTSLKKAE